MTRFDRIEGQLPLILTELATPGMPDYFDNVVSRTSASRQRPAWTFLERWLPMSVITLRGFARSTVPWRTVGVVTLLLIALVVGALLIAGARQRALPLPFGVARTGLVVYETAGDIYASDPATGAATALVTGPAADSQPVWSLDGQRVAFLRDAGKGTSTVHVLDRSTGAISQVTPEPLPIVSGHVFSPDARKIAIAWTQTGQHVVALFSLDGAAPVTVPSPEGATLPSFRPPDGREILFVTGQRWSTEGQGLSTYDLATGDVETLVAPIPGAEIIGRPEYSPDGTRIAYAVWIPVRDINARVYTANADGTGGKLLDAPAGLCCEASPIWSNDGTRLAVGRWLDGPERRVTAIVPWDHGDVGVEFPIPQAYRAIATWSPDDRFVLVTPLNDENGIDRSPQVLLDLETGKAKPIPWVSESDPSVQRLAP